MRKKFYIKKSSQDALAEQNDLLRQLLSQQEETVKTLSEPQAVPNQVQPVPQPQELADPFDFDEADVFIPNIPESSTSLKNVESSQENLDMDNVGKLKKALTPTS